MCKKVWQGEVIIKTLHYITLYCCMVTFPLWKLSISSVVSALTWLSFVTFLICSERSLQEENKIVIHTARSLSGLLTKTVICIVLKVWRHKQKGKTYKNTAYVFSFCKIHDADKPRSYWKISNSQQKKGKYGNKNLLVSAALADTQLYWLVMKWELIRGEHDNV